MKRTSLLGLLLVGCLTSLGCPKRAPTGVTGTDDEQLDHYAAQLEELRSKSQAQEPACQDWCSMAKQVCDISKNICEISKRLPDRGDVQQRCVGSQEDCAHFNDSCGSCRH